MSVLNTYTHFGGQHGATSAAHNMLAAAGVLAPHTGKPFSEEFLLGLGGGLGAGYFTFQYGTTSTLYIGTRALWHNWGADFIERIITRVGGSVAVKESTSAKAAAAALTGALAEGMPVALWVDMSALPYRGEVKYGYEPHVIVACGQDADADTFAVDDRAPKPWTIGGAELAYARGLIKQLKQRSLTITPPKRVPDLKKAVRDAIDDCLADLANPRMKNFGLTALEKWGELVNNPRDAKGWPKAFGSGANLYSALYYTHLWIETSGTGGGGFRTMYAGFLDEAATILGNASLNDVAADYRALGELWTGLAHMALPKKDPLLKRARELSEKKRDLIAKKGPSALKQIAEVTAELNQLSAESKSFAMPDAEAADLRERMHERIVEIHGREIEAAERMKEIL